MNAKDLQTIHNRLSELEESTQYLLEAVEKLIAKTSKLPSGESEQLIDDPNQEQGMSKALPTHDEVDFDNSPHHRDFKEYRDYDVDKRHYEEDMEQFKDRNKDKR